MQNNNSTKQNNNNSTKQNNNNWIKSVLSWIANKVGVLNLGLRVSEYILRNLNLTFSIPFKGYANDIVGMFKKAIEDGELTTDEIADIIKFFRTGTK